MKLEPLACIECLTKCGIAFEIFLLQPDSVSANLMRGRSHKKDRDVMIPVLLH